MCAKCSLRVWEQFAHTFEKYLFLPKLRSFVSGPIFNFCRNLGTREMWTIVFWAYLWLPPIFWRDLRSFAEFLTGFAVIRRFFAGICCHSPNSWRDLLSFAKFLTGFAVIRRIFGGMVSFAELLKGFAIIRRHPKLPHQAISRLGGRGILGT